MATLSRISGMPTSNPVVSNPSVLKQSASMKRRIGARTAGACGLAASYQPPTSECERIIESHMLPDAPPFKDVNRSNASTSAETEIEKRRRAADSAPIKPRTTELSSAVDSFFARKNAISGGTNFPLQKAGTNHQAKHYERWGESGKEAGHEVSPPRRKVGGGSHGNRKRDTQTPEIQAKWDHLADEVVALLRQAKEEVEVAAVLNPLRNRMGRNVFTRAIKKLAAAEDLDTALGVYEWMKTQCDDCKPNAATFAQAIRAAARANKPGKAVGIFEEMQKAGLSPDLYVFSALISGYARAGMHKQALELLDQMKERDIRPDLVVYTTVVNACVKGGLRVGRILELYSDVREAARDANMPSFQKAVGCIWREGVVNLDQNHRDAL
jgi:pentatricopeptide repeat protein